MLLQTKGLAILQGDRNLDEMADKLDKAAQIVRNIEGALRNEGVSVTIKLSPNPSHDFELTGRRDGLGLGNAQRKLAASLSKAGYVGQDLAGDGWAALLYDVWGLRFAVIWATEKED